MQTPLEVLLVEDNEGDIEMTQRAFRDGTPPCNISVANDGAEAMDFLRKRGKFSGAPTPRIILIDLNMPRMDGKQFLKTVKEDRELKGIPVVMLTSSQSPADIRECYELQASCYVVKPFDAKEFMSAVRQIISFWSSLGRLA
jgi:two-component system, chemotaxis family, response regulator Rcp1